MGIDLPITLAHYLYTTVSNSDPLKETNMQVHNETQLLIDKYLKRIKIDYPEDDKLMIDLQDFAKELSINNLSEFERQPVSNNEQPENKCSHNGPRFNPTWGEVVCSICLEQLE